MEFKTKTHQNTTIRLSSHIAIAYLQFLPIATVKKRVIRYKERKTRELKGKKVSYHLIRPGVEI